MRRSNLNSWLLAAPLTGVLVVFLILPILLIVAVSFWTADEFSFRPDFQFGNYEYLFGSAVVRTAMQK
jgi:putative spermidine/putrescine transport system permease protein